MECSSDRTTPRMRSRRRGRRRRGGRGGGRWTSCRSTPLPPSPCSAGSAVSGSSRPSLMWVFGSENLEHSMDCLAGPCHPGRAGLPLQERLCKEDGLLLPGLPESSGVFSKDDRTSLNIIEQPEETGQDRDDIAGLKATKKAQRSIAAMNLKAKPKTRGSSTNNFRRKRPSHCFLARGAQAFHNRPKVNTVVGKVYRFPQDEHKTVKSC